MNVQRLGVFDITPFLRQGAIEPDQTTPFIHTRRVGEWSRKLAGDHLCIYKRDLREVGECFESDVWDGGVSTRVGHEVDLCELSGFES